MSEGKSLRAICRDSDIPSEGTVRDWAIRDVDGFGERHRAARQLLLEYWSDEIVSIAAMGNSIPATAKSALASGNGRSRS